MSELLQFIFRHQHAEDSVVISAALTRIAQEQANAMAMRDSLDHNALAPFSTRIGGRGFCCTARSGSALRMHKMATKFTGQWSSGRNKRSPGQVRTS